MCPACGAVLSVQQLEICEFGNLVASFVGVHAPRCPSIQSAGLSSSNNSRSSSILAERTESLIAVFTVNGRFLVAERFRGRLVAFRVALTCDSELLALAFSDGRVRLRYVHALADFSPYVRVVAALPGPARAAVGEIYTAGVDSAFESDSSGGALAFSAEREQSCVRFDAPISDVLVGPGQTHLFISFFNSSKVGVLQLKAALSESKEPQ